jgi:pyruvate carboxylase
VRANEGLLITDTTWRAAHQSLHGRAACGIAAESGSCQSPIRSSVGAEQAFDILTSIFEECRGSWRRCVKLSPFLSDALERCQRCWVHTSYLTILCSNSVNVPDSEYGYLSCFDSVNYIENMKRYRCRRNVRRVVSSKLLSVTLVTSL